MGKNAKSFKQICDSEIRTITVGENIAKGHNGAKEPSDVKSLGFVGVPPSSDRSAAAVAIRIRKAYLLKQNGADRHEIMRLLGISENTYHSYMKEVGELEFDGLKKEKKANMAVIIAGLNRQILRLETRQQKSFSLGVERELTHLRVVLRDTLQEFKIADKVGDKVELTGADQEPVKLEIVIDDPERAKRIENALKTHKKASRSP